MIIEYQRPTNIPEALELLAREQPITYPLGGGTVLNQARSEAFAVVDLQALNLNGIQLHGNQVRIGATTTLQDILEYPGVPADLYQTLEREATYNQRQVATVAGSLVSGDGKSPLLTALVAVNAYLELQTRAATPVRVSIGDWLPVRKQDWRGRLITQVTIPTQVQLAYEYIARTPADQPIICVAVAQWDSGRTRLALGGWGDVPCLAMDGPNADGIEQAARNAYCQAGDERASGEYRQEMAEVLTRRCLDRLS